MKKKTEKSALLIDRRYYRRPKTTRQLREVAGSDVERVEDPDAVPFRAKQRNLPSAWDDIYPDLSKHQWLKAMRRMVRRGDDRDAIVRRLVQKWGVPHDRAREVVDDHMLNVEQHRRHKNPLSPESQMIVDGYNKAYQLQVAASQPGCPPGRARDLLAEASRILAETRALDARAVRRDRALSGDLLREAKNLRSEASQRDRDALMPGPYGMSHHLQAEADALRKRASDLEREHAELTRRQNPRGLAHVPPGRLEHELRRRGHHGEIYGIEHLMDGGTPVTACWIEDLRTGQVRRVNATLLTAKDFVEVRVGNLVHPDRTA